MPKHYFFFKVAQAPNFSKYQFKLPIVQPGAIRMECLICKNSFPVKIMVDGKRKNLCNRKYCLVCSPWKKHNTKVLHGHTGIADEIGKEKERIFKCCTCKLSFTAHSFYLRKNGMPSGACRKCDVRSKKINQRLKKSILVEEMGGCCTECGYRKSLAALAFHHTTPDNKAYGIANNLNKSLAALRLEAAKCVLLCNNCHTELHHPELSIANE